MAFKQLFRMGRGAEPVCVKCGGFDWAHRVVASPGLGIVRVYPKVLADTIPQACFSIPNLEDENEERNGKGASGQGNRQDGVAAARTGTARGGQVRARA